MMETKLCKRCGEVKPVEMFYKQKGGSYLAYCKKCQNEYNKENTARRRDRERKKLFNSKNK